MNTNSPEKSVVVKPTSPDTIWTKKPLLPTPVTSALSTWTAVPIGVVPSLIE